MHHRENSQSEVQLPEDEDENRLYADGRCDGCNGKFAITKSLTALLLFEVQLDLIDVVLSFRKHSLSLAPL